LDIKNEAVFKTLSIGVQDQYDENPENR